MSPRGSGTGTSKVLWKVKPNVWFRAANPVDALGAVRWPFKRACAQMASKSTVFPDPARPRMSKRAPSSLSQAAMMTSKTNPNRKESSVTPHCCFCNGVSVLLDKNQW